MRRSIPTPVPVESTTPEAKARHRDGMSCIDPIAYIYDANGRGRWCADCGAELGLEASWHPEGSDVSPLFIGFCIVVLAWVLGMVVALLVWGGPSSSSPDLPRATPTTYGPPPATMGR
jgi:hypothetical protein